MTVTELIKALQSMPADAVVYTPTNDQEETGSGFTPSKSVWVFPLRQKFFGTFDIVDESKTSGVVIR